MSTVESARELPVFVYGTLRPGGGNYRWLLAGNTTDEQPATLPGAVMHEGPGFPYVVDGHATVVGCLVALDPRRCGQVLDRLDRLEGYRPHARSNHYHRVVRTVDTAGGPRDAWVYLSARTPTGPVVPAGDWLNRPAGAVVGVG